MSVLTTRFAMLRATKTREGGREGGKEGKGDMWCRKNKSIFQWKKRGREGGREGGKGGAISLVDLQISLSLPPFLTFPGLEAHNLLSRDARVGASNV